MVPPSAMLVKVTVPLPVFCTVVACAALVEPVFCAAYVRLEGVKLRLLVIVCPVPLNPTFCGLPVALSVKVNEAVRVPFAVGLKVIPTVQLLPAVSDAGQLFKAIV